MREILLYSNSQNNPDMLYFSGISIPDAFFAFTHKSKRCAILSKLEIGRAKKNSLFDEIFSQELSHIELFKKLKIKKFLVPANFPALTLENLRKENFDIKVCETEIFPERECKSKKEIQEIILANKAASNSFARVEEILRESKISKDKILWQNKILTSEILRQEIEITCIKSGAIAADTIVACGNQACDPHCIGYGKISPNQTIVVDIFPKTSATSYYGDMTRTFLKGKANDAQIDLYNTVKKAHGDALKKVRAGIDGNFIYENVCKFFEKNNYKTFSKNNQWQGFFHGLGHGIGLAIHESPNVGRTKNILKENAVVTIEPGLYYLGLGACRIEDNVLLKKDKSILLSDYNYNFVIE